VVSQALLEHYARHYGRRTVYIPNGSTVPTPRPPQRIKDLGLDRHSYILFVGRLVPEKGCHTLLQAFGRVRTDKHLVIAGRATYDDGYRHHLDEAARGLQRVHFVGFVQGDLLHEFYANAYLVTHPAELEGLSISLLEAMSYGNCVLVSNTAENREAIGNQGYLFAVGDSVDLAKQLQYLLDHEDQVEAMRARVRAGLSAVMDWKAVSEATWTVYQQLARTRVGPLKLNSDSSPSVSRTAPPSVGDTGWPRSN